jgi:hypothetical protein
LIKLKIYCRLLIARGLKFYNELLRRTSNLEYVSREMHVGDLHAAGVDLWLLI